VSLSLSGFVLEKIEHHDAANNQLVELTEEDLAQIDSVYPVLSFRACGPLWTGWGSLGMEDVVEN